MSDPSVKQQQVADEIGVRRAQQFQSVFGGTVHGPEVLRFITEELCRIGKQLPAVSALGPTGESAIYWGGRGDVGRAIMEILNYVPRSEAVVVKTRKQG